MPTLDSTRVLSTPKVLVNGRVLKIIPNSLKMSLGGESKVRAVSSGGGGHEIVAGLNAEELKASVKVTVANTAEMVDFVRQIKELTNQGIGSTMRVVETTVQFAFTTMYLVNKPELGFEAEGSIDLEFEGAYVP